MMYHLRILSLGALIIAALGGVGFLLALLPFWVVETPLLVIAAYVMGKFIEAWSRT